MFCNQCEQTARGGCTTIGVCGKKNEVAALQDLLTYAVRGLCHLTVAGRSVEINDAEINRFSMKAIFSTLTSLLSTLYFLPIRQKIGVIGFEPTTHTANKGLIRCADKPKTAVLYIVRSKSGVIFRVQNLPRHRSSISGCPP